jgi:hypothetical protein
LPPRQPAPRPADAEPTGSEAPQDARAAPRPASQPAAGSGARQSILAGVRRTARAAGPTIITDYSYVTKDLRRIGVLAGAAFAILIGLSFVVR